MLSDFLCWIKSLWSKRRQDDGKRFIEKFALATRITAEEVERLKNDLGIDRQTAVKATLLIDVYGIHLALLSDAARKLIQDTDKIEFETRMLFRFVEESLKKLGLSEHAQGMYQEISQHVKEIDAEFYANFNETNGPFPAVTKRFLRIICGKDFSDIAVITFIASGIGSNMKYTTEMFQGLYENGCRY